MAETLNARLSKKTVAILRVMATGYDIDVPTKIKKKQLVALVAGEIIAEADRKPKRRKPKPKYAWFVLRTTPGKESQVRRHVLRKFRIEFRPRDVKRVLLARQKTIELRKGKRTIFLRKKFPGYLLVHCRNDAETFAMFDRVIDCWGFLTMTIGSYAAETNDQKPVPLPLDDEEAANILLQHQEDSKRGDVQVTTGLQPGDAIRIKDKKHMFDGFLGTVKKVAGDGTANPLITVVVRVLGRPVIVELKDWQLIPTDEELEDL